MVELARRQRTAPAALASFALTLICLGVSIYLTVDHFSSAVSLACPESATINCAKVTSSAWSHVGPASLALLGLIFFLAMAALCSPAAWRRPRLDYVRVAGAVAAVISSLYLVWVELFKVDAICTWCTVIHVSSVALLGTVLWQLSTRPAVGRV